MLTFTIGCVAALVTEGMLCFCKPNWFGQSGHKSMLVTVFATVSHLAFLLSTDRVKYTAQRQLVRQCKKLKSRRTTHSHITYLRSENTYSLCLLRMPLNVFFQSISVAEGGSSRLSHASWICLWVTRLSFDDYRVDLALCITIVALTSLLCLSFWRYKMLLIIFMISLL